MRNPYLLKRANGKYYIVYWIRKDGKYIKKYQTTGESNKASANEKFNKFLPAEHGSNILFSQFRDKLKPIFEVELAKNTQIIYNKAFDLVLQHVGDKELKNYTRFDFDIIKTKLQKHYSDVSSNIYIRSIKIIFNRAIEYDYLEVNPLHKIKQFAITQKRNKHFTDLEVRSFLEYIKKNDYTFYHFVKFALFTGCRVSEICALKIKDMDFDNGLCEVYEIKTKKTKVIPIHKELMDYMATLNRDTPDEFVFVNSHNLPYTKDRAGIKFRRVLKSLNITGRSFHSLRHTFITKLSTLKINPYTMMNLAGHSSIDTTQIYVGKDIETLRNAVEGVGY